ncbi:MAG: hypothetical protein GKC10_01510 [Methanosarcinales archaeon]|nr:hypothetical protein [Methanosarcinales archaeon]
MKGAFLVDHMLLRLGRGLRMAGLDVENPGDEDDRGLMSRAREGGRTLITRDRELSQACARAGQDCILIRSSRLDDQLQEMARAGVTFQQEPARCTLCNGPLVREESLVAEESPAMEGSSIESPGDFEEQTKECKIAWRCLACGQTYWQGSHWKGIAERFERLAKDRQFR